MRGKVFLDTNVFVYTILYSQGNRIRNFYIEGMRNRR